MSKLKAGDNIIFIKEYRSDFDFFPKGHKTKLFFHKHFNLILIPYINANRSGIIAEAMLKDGYIKVIKHKIKLP